MKLILFLFFTIGTIQIKGQNLIDSVIFKVTYNSTYKLGQESSIKQDIQILEIGHEISKYYSRYDYEFQHTRDSLKKSGLNEMEMQQRLYGGKGLNSGENYQVFKNYPDEGKLTYTYVIFNFPYLYEESMPAMKWNLVEGDTIIGGYNCKKAVCELRGRTWTAWYTFDLPYSDGPWKLCRLPGLILEAKEDEGIFTFSFAGIERCDAPMTFSHKNKYERCTPKQLQDAFSDYCKQGSSWVIRKATGLSVDMGTGEKSFTPCLIEHYE